MGLNHLGVFLCSLTPCLSGKLGVGWVVCLGAGRPLLSPTHGSLSRQTSPDLFSSRNKGAKANKRHSL